jgi:lipopolysaccharide export system permease protein
MMRILDRYILGTFLWALAVFSIGFTTLVLVADFAVKIGKFLELKNVAVLPFIGLYYAVRLPMAASYLLPTVVLFASMFTVIKLARTNEILPIAASGTSLRRMTFPFLGTAFLATTAIAASEEFVLPRLREEISRTEEILVHMEMSYDVEAYDGWTKLRADSYDHVGRRIKGRVRIEHLDEDAQTDLTVSAQRGQWDDLRKRWVVFDGEIEYPKQVVYPENAKPHTRRLPIPPEGFVVPASFGPQALIKSRSFTSRFPFAPLSELIADARRYPRLPSMRVKVYARFAFPLSPVILLLLGLPFVVTAASKSFLKGLFIAFLLALAYYVAYMGFLDLGNQGVMPPPAAAFGPTGAFGAAGMMAFARMRT